MRRFAEKLLYILLVVFMVWIICDIVKHGDMSTESQGHYEYAPYRTDGIHYVYVENN